MAGDRCEGGSDLPALAGALSLTSPGCESLLDLPDSLLILTYQHAREHILPHRAVCRCKPRNPTAPDSPNNLTSPRPARRFREQLAHSDAFVLRLLDDRLLPRDPAADLWRHYPLAGWMLRADATFAAVFDGEGPAAAAARRRPRALGQSVSWAAFAPRAPARPERAPCARALWALARAVRDAGFGRLERLRLRAADLSVPAGGGVDGAGRGGDGGAAAALATALGGSRGLEKLDLRQCEVPSLLLLLFLVLRPLLLRPLLLRLLLLRRRRRHRPLMLLLLLHFDQRLVIYLFLQSMARRQVGPAGATAAAAAALLCSAPAFRPLVKVFDRRSIFLTAVQILAGLRGAGGVGGGDGGGGGAAVLGAGVGAAGPAAAALPPRPRGRHRPRRRAHDVPVPHPVRLVLTAGQTCFDRWSNMF
jgi:hypothetical protein